MVARRTQLVTMSQLPGKLLETFSSADFPADWPYDEEDMSRLDETADIQFYGAPRFVTHIDDGAIGAVTEFYRQALP